MEHLQPNDSLPLQIRREMKPPWRTSVGSLNQVSQFEEATRISSQMFQTKKENQVAMTQLPDNSTWTTENLHPPGALGVCFIFLRETRSPWTDTSEATWSKAPTAFPIQPCPLHQNTGAKGVPSLLAKLINFVLLNWSQDLRKHDQCHHGRVQVTTEETSSGPFLLPG